MRILCPISGLEYFTDHFKDSTTVFDPHPIFRMPARNLLARAKEWGKGRYDDTENKLLFLALLNATSAVKWEVPAAPETSTCLKHTEAMFRLIAWYSEIGNTTGSLKLPEFRCSNYNYTLANIGNYITAWYEVRKEWMQPSIRIHLQELLESREIVLDKLIHSWTKTTEDYGGHLGRWALDAAEVVGEDKRKEWLDIFRLKGDLVFSADIEEIRDCLNWMQDKLYAPGSHGAGHGSRYSGKVLEHLTKILRKAENGRIGELYDGDPTKLFRIKHDEEDIDLTEENIQTQLDKQQAPEAEPRMVDYAGRLGDYVREKARWVLAQKYKDLLAAVKDKNISMKGL